MCSACRCSRQVILHLNNGSFTTGKVKLVFRLGAYADENNGEVQEGSVLTEANELAGGRQKNKGPAAHNNGNGNSSHASHAAGTDVQLQQPSLQLHQQQLGGQASGLVGGVDQTDQASEHFSTYNQQVLSTSTLIIDNFKVPLKVHIRGIACIDLKSVHTLASNSPCVNMACGKFVCKTDVSVCYLNARTQ